jgi:anion-transporting  ArsA/GET3 family ATPase
MAFAAACGGYHVLLIELEGYSNLGRSLGVGELGYDPVEVDLDLFGQDAANGASTSGHSDRSGRGRLEVMQLRPDEALADYLNHTGLGPLIRRFSRSEAVEVVSAAAPGIRDLVTLGKIRQLEQADVADIIIVDAPASGHAISFLTSPAGMAESTNSGPIKEQADQVLTMLADEARCQVMLVTLPEETPVTETVETAFALEDEVGVSLGPVVVNGEWSQVSGLAEAVAAWDSVSDDDNESAEAAVEAARYRLSKIKHQQEQIARLDDELPLPQIRLPHLFVTSIGTGEIAALAAEFTKEPA